MHGSELGVQGHGCDYVSVCGGAARESLEMCTGALCVQVLK